MGDPVRAESESEQCLWHTKGHPRCASARLGDAEYCQAHRAVAELLKSSIPIVRDLADVPIVRDFKHLRGM